MIVVIFLNSFSFLVCFFTAETPIEEFTPTPAFPALQYLESVDVEGVAWRAGLRTGDFLIEVINDSTCLFLNFDYFITEHAADGLKQIKEKNPTTSDLCTIPLYNCGHDILFFLCLHRG